MSRTPSSVSPSSGMQVATRSSGGVFSVLTLIATAFLIVGIVVAMMASDKLFGYTMPFGDKYDAAKKELADNRQLKDGNDAVTELLNKYDLDTGLTGHGGAAAEAPAASGATAPVTPPTAPTTAAPAGP